MKARISSSFSCCAGVATVRAERHPSGDRPRFPSSSPRGCGPFRRASSNARSGSSSKRSPGTTSRRGAVTRCSGAARTAMALGRYEIRPPDTLDVFLAEYDATRTARRRLPAGAPVLHRRGQYETAIARFTLLERLSRQRVLPKRALLDRRIALLAGTARRGRTALRRSNRQLSFELPSRGRSLPDWTSSSWPGARTSSSRCLQWSHEEYLSALETFQQRERSYQEALRSYREQTRRARDRGFPRSEIRTLNERVIAELEASQLAERDARINELLAQLRQASARGAAARMRSPVSDQAPTSGQAAGTTSPVHRTRRCSHGRSSCARRYSRSRHRRSSFRSSCSSKGRLRMRVYSPVLLVLRRWSSPPVRSRSNEVTKTRPPRGYIAFLDIPSHGVEWIPLFVADDPRTSVVEVLEGNRVHRHRRQRKLPAAAEQTPEGARFVWTSPTLRIAQTFRFTRGLDAERFNALEMTSQSPTAARRTVARRSEAALRHLSRRAHQRALRHARATEITRELASARTGKPLRCERSLREAAFGFRSCSRMQIVRTARLLCSRTGSASPIRAGTMRSTRPQLQPSPVLDQRLRDADRLPGRAARLRRALFGRSYLGDLSPDGLPECQHRNRNRGSVRIARSTHRARLTDQRAHRERFDRPDTGRSLEGRARNAFHLVRGSGRCEGRRR